MKDPIIEMMEQNDNLKKLLIPGSLVIPKADFEHLERLAENEARKREMERLLEGKQK